MAKRKRHTSAKAASGVSRTPILKTKFQPLSNLIAPFTVQIIAGSYDRALHGIAATILPTKDVKFADNFLFNAHMSAIRCLALSPPSAPVSQQSQKIFLASGGTDERINLYHLSAQEPSRIIVPVISSLTSKAIVENPQNRELGSFLHHAGPITALFFPNRSKLLSSAEDRQIAVMRTRDWTLLSSIKSPAPKEAGRPSGDTAPTGGAPSGVNDFAVHPSMKLMITVGKGENCMRLWNLVTGKKAGVLNFDKDHLGEVGEGRYNTGEGHKVTWGSTDAGDEFSIGFNRGVLVYGMDGKPKCKVLPEPRTKLHQLHYVRIDANEDIQLMVISTEDGRIAFYSTRPDDLIAPSEGKDGLPSATLVAQVGGKAADLTGRVKDFAILTSRVADFRELIIVSAGSDGAIRLWRIATKDLESRKGKEKQIGTLLGTYETGNRITCLAAFMMLPRTENAEIGDSGEFEGLEKDEEDHDNESSSDCN